MSTDWLTLAKNGDLEALMELAYAGEEAGGDDEEEGDEQDGTALKWLLVASDFGHEEADDMIADLYESSSLRYDDDQFVTGEVHLDLGVAYLLGSDGLPKDVEKARAHLEAAEEAAFPASVEGGEEILAEIRAKLSAETRAVFDAVYKPE